MTTREEEIRSMEMTRDFLYSLLNKAVTPRVPKKIRAKASACLRHYPLTNITSDGVLYTPSTGTCRNRLSLRATGNNRYMGGSSNWLNIRRIEDLGDEYALFVMVRGFEKSIGIPKERIKSGEPTLYLKFRVDGQPCSINNILAYYYGELK